MQGEIDINAADQRAHDLRVVTIVCRYSLAFLLASVGACAYRCDPEQRTRRVEAKSYSVGNQAKGVADECRRWTP